MAVKCPYCDQGMGASLVAAQERSRRDKAEAELDQLQQRLTTVEAERDKHYESVKALRQWRDDLERDVEILKSERDKLKAENERLRKALNEIEMNTKSSSLTFSQAHYKIEMVNRVAKAALREVG